MILISDVILGTEQFSRFSFFKAFLAMISSSTAVSLFNAHYCNSPAWLFSAFFYQQQCWKGICSLLFYFWTFERSHAWHFVLVRCQSRWINFCIIPVWMILKRLTKTQRVRYSMLALILTFFTVAGPNINHQSVTYMNSR